MDYTQMNDEELEALYEEIKAYRKNKRAKRKEGIDKIKALITQLETLTEEYNLCLVDCCGSINLKAIMVSSV